MAFIATPETVFHALLGAAVTFPVGDPSTPEVPWVINGTTVVAGTWNEYARRFDGTTDYIKLYDATTPSAPFVGFSQAMYDAFRGGFTFFILFRPANPILANGQLFAFGTTSTSIFRALLNSIEPADMVESHTRGSGLTQLVSGSNDVIYGDRPYIWTVTMSGGVYKFFLNGALYYESPTLFVPTTSPGDAARWGTSIGAGGVSSVSARYAGDIEEIFVENVCRSEDYIRELVMEMFASVVSGPPDETAPVISNMVPTPGAPGFNKSTRIQFDVTDSVGLGHLPVYAKFPSLGLWELVYDGTNFAPAYVAGESTVEAISGGLHFDIWRGRGWLATPTIGINPHDTSGNEG